MQQQRAAETRERIIEGAARVFAEAGYAAASLSDITAAAGVSKGALYFHFATKEEIARAIVTIEQEIGQQRAGAIIDGAASPLEAVMALCADFAILLDSSIVIRAGVRLAGEAAEFDPPIRGVFDDWFPMMSNLLAEAMADGEVRADHDPDTLARFVIPAFTGVHLASGATTGYADIVPRLREMWLILLRALVTDDRMEATRAALDRVLPATDATRAARAQGLVEPAVTA